MNTFGKILAVCNFVIAIAVIAFLLVDFGTRTNWVPYTKALKDELEVFKNKVQTNDKTNADLNVQIKRVEEDKRTVEKNMIKLDEDFKADLIAKKQEVDDALIKAKDADLQTQVALAETDRLKLEVNGLQGTLKKREGTIVSLEEEIKKYRGESLAAKNNETTMQARNLALLDQIRKLSEQLLAIQNKGTGGTGTLPNILRDPNAPNPPSVKVKGQVDVVNLKDKSLVQLSVGTDHGVNKNHTLEIYRMLPRSEYLGTVRILDSYPHYSVGKLMHSSLPHSPLQVGDIVSDRIGP